MLCYAGRYKYLGARRLICGTDPGIVFLLDSLADRNPAQEPAGGHFGRFPDFCRITLRERRMEKDVAGVIFQAV